MAELPAESSLPPGLRSDWPVPRQEVLGRRDGPGAHIEAFLASNLLAGAARLPYGVRDTLVRRFARIACRLDRSRSRSAREFITQALGELPADELDARVLQAWRHFFTVLIETEGWRFHVAPETARDHYEVELGEDAERALRERTGSIFVTPHVGDWEAAAALGPLLGFDPFYAVAKPPANRPLSILVQEARERRGIRLIPRKGAMRNAGPILAAGGGLGLLLDHRGGERGVVAPFFGRPARCDRSGAVLLKRHRAPLIFGACYRTETPYRWKARLPSGLWPEEALDLSAEELATRINEELERLILAAPDQYFWLHDRYRFAPASGDQAADPGGPADGADGADTEKDFEGAA